MSFKITGADQVIKNLETKLGKNRVNRVVNKALREAGENFEKRLRPGIDSYKDTGATLDELVVSGVRTVGGVKMVRIGFNGPMKRYKLVHLNEFGYDRFGKRVTPRGFGVIQKTIDSTQDETRRIIRDRLKELVK